MPESAAVNPKDFEIQRGAASRWRCHQRDIIANEHSGR